MKAIQLSDTAKTGPNFLCALHFETNFLTDRSRQFGYHKNHKRCDLICKYQKP